MFDRESKYTYIKVGKVGVHGPTQAFEAFLPKEKNGQNVLYRTYQYYIYICIYIDLKKNVPDSDPC